MSSTYRAEHMEIEDYWDATEEFSRDDKNQAGFIAPVGKGHAKGEKPHGVLYNFGKGSSTKGEGKMHEGLGFQPERGEQRKFGGFRNWCWRIGHKEVQCWFKQEFMKSNPSQDPSQRDIREWSNTSEKGQGHSQPKGKSKGKGKGKRKYPGKGNYNQDQAGSPNEDGQRTLGDFGIKRQRVEFVCDVQENDDFETPRLDRAALCFAFKSAIEMRLIPRNCQVRRFKFLMGVWSQRALIKKFDQSTREVLFAVGCRDDRPTVDSGSVVSTCPVDYATSVPTEKVHHSMNFESVLGESLQHHGIKRNVPFIHRTGSSMNVNSVCAQRLRQWLDDRVHSRWKGKIVNDTKCIDQVKQIMGSTPGFDIVYDRGAYVLDVDVNDGVCVNEERQKFESDC